MMTKPTKPETISPFKIRSATKEDISFLFSSWLKSFRDSGTMCRNITNTVYFESHHKLIERILRRASVNVACDADHPDQLFGYIVAETIDGIFVLHYIYVKHPFRRTGIGSALLNSFQHNSSLASCTTHLTRMGERLLLKYNMIYHPYIVINNYDIPEADQVPDENS